MHVSIDDFWKLLAASELQTRHDCEALAREFANLRAATGQANSKSLAEWLVASGKLTRYQAAVLLTGRPGPFRFGPFVVTERIEKGRLARLFRDRYEDTQPVLLVLLSLLTDDVHDYQSLADLANSAAAVRARTSAAPIVPRDKAARCSSSRNPWKENRWPTRHERKRIRCRQAARLAVRLHSASSHCTSDRSCTAAFARRTFGSTRRARPECCSFPWCRRPVAKSDSSRR